MDDTTKNEDQNLDPVEKENEHSVKDNANEGESQDPSQDELNELENYFEKNNNKSGKEVRQETIEALTKKVIQGETDYESIEENPAQKWALEEVKSNVDKYVSKFQSDHKYEELKSEVDTLKKELQKERLEKEKEAAFSAVGDFLTQRGLSYEEFKKSYPEFEQTYENLKGQVGLKQAVTLSLNNIIANESSNNQVISRVPTGGSFSAANDSKLSRGQIEAARKLGVTPEQLEKYSEDIKKIQIK